LQIYRKDSNRTKPLLNNYQPQDLNIDSKIKFIIIISSKNSLRNNKINKINSNNNLDYLNKLRNYLTLQSIAEQANNKVSSESSPAIILETLSELEPASTEPIPSESSSSRAEIPSHH